MKVENNEIKMIQISEEELAVMKAEEEVMKQNIADMQIELFEKNEELETTKKSLSEMLSNLQETRDLLQGSLKLQARYENVAQGCLDTQKAMLNKWLSRKNQKFVEMVLGFYKVEGQMQMIKAILDYLLFGKKAKMWAEVSQTHFDVICDRIDEDAITLPAHSFMVKLIVKYGLFEKIKDQLV